MDFTTRAIISGQCVRHLKRKFFGQSNHNSKIMIFLLISPSGANDYTIQAKCSSVECTSPLNGHLLDKRCAKMSSHPPPVPLLIKMSESMNHAVPHLLRYDKNAAGIQNPDGKDVLSITDKNIHLQSSSYAREIAVPSGFYKELNALSCNVEIN